MSVVFRQSFLHVTETKAAFSRSRSEEPQSLPSPGVELGHLTRAWVGAPAPRSAASAGPTTLMLRNIPNSVKQWEVAEFVDLCGLKDEYDVIYMPTDKRSGCNRGYSFVNFLSARKCETAMEQLSGRRFSSKLSDKVTKVALANVQGREALLAINKESNQKVLQVAHLASEALTWAGSSGSSAASTDSSSPHH
mmetsp:Transcript_58460/g.156259  ORF Transcript_58460/g.156259 Transcript_58460/m.156259 type:complete len:193 (+) Transcript_58460:52-630(+)